MIGYYIHHSGYGHLARAHSIVEHLRQPVTALSSAHIDTPHPFADVIGLPRDDTGSEPANPTAHGVWHWAPHHDAGLRQRMRVIADWADTVRPAAVVVDVSVEVAALVRLLGIPTIVIAMPGSRTDSPHTWVYQMADHIIAAWPRELYEPEWLRIHRRKTTYVGGISRFDGRPHPQRARRFRVAILGCGGSAITAAAMEACAVAHPDYDWLPIGIGGREWMSDPWPALASAHAVIAHAGQSSVADLAVASAPAVVIPQSKPFDEQRTTATVLDSGGLAVSAPRWPEPQELETLLARAVESGGRRWPLWQTRGAAQRAATVIEDIASCRMGTVTS